MNLIHNKGIAGTVLAISLVGGLVATPLVLEATGVTPVASASAHDKAAVLTCAKATVSLTNYDRNATVKVTLDDVVKVDGKIPGSGYFLNETLVATVNHSLVVTVRSNDGSQYNMDFSETTTDCAPAPPNQEVKCDTITADYHRPLTNGDHINVDIKVLINGVLTKIGQVNAFVDQNVDGGANYGGQNKLGIKMKIFDVDKTPLPLTLDQIKSGIITFAYGPALTDALAEMGYYAWTVSFVQTNETDTWLNFKCDTTKEDADATVSVKTAETCTASSTVIAVVENAKQVRDGVVQEDIVLDQSVGTHSTTFRATGASLFPGKLKEVVVTYTVKAADPTLCPMDATALISIKDPATCLASSTIEDTLVNATWESAFDLSVGPHTAWAVASLGHLFADASQRMSVTYTIYEPDASLCPQDASASVKVTQQERCLVSTEVEFDIAHATWDAEPDLSVGSHTRSASAVDGYRFPGGSAHLDVPYVIKAADPSLCPQDGGGVSTDAAPNSDNSSTIAGIVAIGGIIALLAAVVIFINWRRRKLA